MHILKRSGQLVLILIWGIFLSACNQAPVRPNIILFMVDDMGWQDSSVPFWTEKTAFNLQYNTPAYACAVCSPTRVSLMTGMNAARHRVTNWTLRKDTMMVKAPVGLIMPPWNMNSIAVDTTLNNAIFIHDIPSAAVIDPYLPAGGNEIEELPVPADKSLSLKLSPTQMESGMELSIVNLVRSIIHSREVSNTVQDHLTIDTSKFQDGIDFLSISSSGQPASRRIVVLQ